MFNFDVITFEPLTLDEYKQRYRASIKVDFDVDKVFGVTPGVVFPRANHSLNLTWDEEIQVVTKGSVPAVVRLPALIIDGSLFLLDGHHRMTELKPRWVVLDTLHLEDAAHLKHLTRGR
ncbi:hypothetical protein LCGC14_0696380 [marine sediment metagenome]|uniref:Uncharacterized protein n=1 Tax=marine sediment metagenome TaxID=412755 RepID=A0A0F9T524_9ZZZZ